MRRKGKQLGAMFLAIVIASTSMTMPVSAKTTTTVPKGNAAKLLQMAQEKTGKNEEADKYKEGEAVVMYYGADTSKEKANNRKIFGDDITIEETYNFTSAQSTSAASRGSGQKLLVSKVSSKTYSTEKLVKQLKKQTNVQYAEPNYIYKAAGTTNTGKYAPYQWALENVGQNQGTPGCDINIESAWEQKTGTDKVIAIIDTGVDYTHDDLNTNMWTNPYTTQLKGEHGYDFVNYDEDPLDDNGHGSHCAGIIAGNGTGVSGVNKTAKIMALKFLDEEGSGDLSGAVGAYDYINRAMNLGVDIVAVNNSWGGGEGSDILIKLINLVGAKGAITVAAAGNDGMDVDDGDNEPWNFESDYVIKVAASNENDELANFSNYGANTVDLAAPGADILSSVSSYVYNPSIHTEDADYSELLSTFDNDTDILTYKTIECPKGSGIELTTGEGTGFGNTKNNSLEMKVNAQDDDYIYVAYQPITLPESTSTYHTSAMVKASAEAEYGGYCMVFMGIDKITDIENVNKTGELEGILMLTDGQENRNYWDMLSVDTEKEEYAQEDGYAVWFAVIAMTPGQYTIQLDNVGFSKQNMDDSELGKYAFYNGTSMAAPQVTGAVALISELKGEMEPIELRDTVAACVRTADSCENTTISGGVLDLSKVNTQTPMIKKIITGKEELTIKGSFFGNDKGTITINGAEAAVKSWSKNEIVVAAGNNHNKEVTIQLATTSKQTTQRKAYLDYNETEISQLGEIDEFGTRLVGTDGTNLYSLCEDGSFYGYSSQTRQWTTLGALSLTVLDKEGVLTEQTFKYDSQLVYANHGFYTVVEYDAGYYSTKVVVYYNLETAQWTKAAEWPSDLADAEAATLAAYKETVYLLGGYDSKEEKVLGSIYTLDYKNGATAFVKDQATIPARFGAVAHVVENKLVLTLGGDGTMDENLRDDVYVSVPNNVVFDGTSWTEVKNSSFVPTQCEYYMVNETEVLPYYTAQTGIYNGGIIYTDLYTKDLGNVFTYNVKENKYSALPCSLYSYKDEYASMYGTTVADQFMFITGVESYNFMGWEDWSKTKAYEYFEEMEEGFDYDYTLNSFDIETGFFKVTGDYTAIDGVGYYYPGSTVTLTPVMGNGQYLVSFLVDGEEVKEGAYTIASIAGNHQAEAVMDQYITSITFDKTDYTAVVGQPLVLNAIVKKGDSSSNTGSGTMDDWNDIFSGLSKESSYDEYFNPDEWGIPDDWFITTDDTDTGSDTNLIWSVDNKKYATIQDGVLVGVKVGIGKNVTVTATAADGSGVSASVTVEIRENSILAKKLSISKKKVSVKEGKSCRLKASLSPSEVSNKNLIWESSKSTVAMVSSTGEVIGLKPGKATITVRTTDGSKLSATCAVEITPKNVTKLAAKQTTDSITLFWKKVDRATGYTIYRYDAKKKKDIAVYTTNKASKVSVKLSKLNGKTGKKLTAGTEYTYKVAAFTKVGNGKIYGEKVTIKTATKPAAAKVVSVKKKSAKKATVTWKKVNGATGYEVYVSTSKKGSFKKETVVKSAKATSYTQSGLKNGKTYYYKVRAYKKVKGTMIYGEYSNVKSVKL